MKKTISLLIALCLLFSSAPVGYAVGINADFTESVSPLNVGAGLVEISSDPLDESNSVAKISGSSESDSYLSTGNNDFSQLTYINLKFYRAPGSSMRFYFRDTVSTANNVTIINIGKENISLGSESVAISDNTWYRLRIVLDKPNDSVSYYLVSDSESLSKVTECKFSDFTNADIHGFSSTSLRFSVTKTTEENTAFYFDDISIKNESSNISFDDGIFMNSRLEKLRGSTWTAVGRVSQGDYRIVTSLENYENADRQLTVINAVYDKDGLMKSFTPYTVTIATNSAAQKLTPFSLSDLAEGDVFKTYIFDSIDNISPLSHDFSYEKVSLNYNAEPEFHQTMVDAAIDSSALLAYTSKGGNTGNSHSASALYYLLLAEHTKPGITSSAGNSAKDKALTMIRHLTAGGNEPYACVGCYWTHAIVAASMVMAKNTPTVWDELTAEEQERIDWLMRCLSIAGNWGFNDQNDYKTGFDLLGNFRKTWNPNYRNTYLNVVISGAQYFGADELDEIFVSFDYDTYIAKLTELGYTNILSTWTVAGKDLMENGGSCVLAGGVDDRYEEGMDGGSGAGVKIKFTYSGYSLHELDKIFENLMLYTYSDTVVSSVVMTEDFTAGIASGATSPYEGLMGMMLEFNSGDGGGKRSSASYCLDSLIALIPTYANLKLFGSWNSEFDGQVVVDERIFIGTEDLIFKIEEGYNNFSLGSFKGTTKYAAAGSANYHYTKDVWRAFHMTFENPYIEE